MAITSILALAYLTRLIWLELLLQSMWCASIVISPRRRLALAVRIIEARAKLLGHSRPTASPPRQWLLDDVTRNEDSESRLRKLVESFCDLADCIYFGDPDAVSVGPRQVQIASSLVGSLPMRTLKRTLSENRS